MDAYIGTVHTNRERPVNPCLRIPRELTFADMCLENDANMWEQAVKAGVLHNLCCGSREVPPWVKMPKEGRRFAPISTLLVSTVIPFTGTNQLVLSERVPYGYDGVIEDYVCELLADAATGFTEGSGDVTWRLAADNRFLRDSGKLQVTIGSLTQASPIPRGKLRVYSGNLLKFFVSFAVGAEARINPNARVVCSVRGYYYPR